MTRERLKDDQEEVLRTLIDKIKDLDENRALTYIALYTSAIEEGTERKKALELADKGLRGFEEKQIRIIF